MARYAQRFKDQAVARLLPPESASVDTVAHELGVGLPPWSAGIVWARVSANPIWQPASCAASPQLAVAYHLPLGRATEESGPLRAS